MENKLYLYRYFDRISDPFESLFDYSYTSPEHFVEYMKKNNLKCKEIYTIDYYKNRIDYESRMKKMFSSVGGVVDRKTPCYFTLENADDWFKKRKAYKFSLAIPLCAFMGSDITFTYGDSYPVFRHRGCTKANLFMFEDADMLNDRKRYPLYPQCKYDYLNYIEAQVWNDRVIRNYRPNFDYFTKNWMEHINLLASALLDTNIQLRNIEKYNLCNIDISDVIKYLKYIEITIQSIPVSYFPLGEIHGKNHLLKVTILTMFLLLMQTDFTEQEICIVLDAALCHDLGRMNTGNHAEHALQSVEKYRQALCNEAKREVETIILMHDKTRSEITKNIESIKFKRMIETVQDADALDYIRFGADKFNREKLRHPKAQLLLHLAMELNVVTFAYHQSPMEYIYRKIRTYE